MKKLSLDLRKIKLYGYNGIIAAVALFAAFGVLIYLLVHNPYKNIHEQIFKTAENIRKYYSDQPGYWKLSTQSALDDHLVDEGLLKQNDFELKIGIGENGDIAMPSDTDFDITLKKLNKSSCIGLVEAPTSKAEQLGLQKITVINKDGTTEFAWGDEKHPLPIAKYKARNTCQPVDNTVIWTFH